VLFCFFKNFYLKTAAGFVTMSQKSLPMPGFPMDFFGVFVEISGAL